MTQTLGLIALFAFASFVLSSEIPGAWWQWGIVSLVTSLAFVTVYGNSRREH